MSREFDDEMWRAIGDPTRRRILDLLLETDEATASSLRDVLPVSRQAVAKHLTVLERMDLVNSSVVGRERIYRLDDVQLARAARQLAAVGSAWDARLQRIARISEAAQRQQNT